MTVLMPFRIRHGHKVLFLFEEEDDAERYAMMLYDEEDADMDIVEVDDELAIKTCKYHSYKVYDYYT